jgi:hypothetical protein
MPVSGEVMHSVGIRRDRAAGVFEEQFLPAVVALNCRCASVALAQSRMFFNSAIRRFFESFEI